MKKLTIMLLIVLIGACAYLAEQALAATAKAEDKVAFYANITAIQPIMEEFTKNKGVKGEYTRISTSKFLATVLTEHHAGKLMADVLQAPLPILEFQIDDRNVDGAEMRVQARPPLASEHAECPRRC